MIGVYRFAVSQGGAQFLGTRGTFVDVVIAREEVDHDLRSHASGTTLRATGGCRQRIVL